MQYYCRYDTVVMMCIVTTLFAACSNRFIVFLHYNYEINLLSKPLERYTNEHISKLNVIVAL